MAASQEGGSHRFDINHISFVIDTKHISKRIWFNIIPQYFPIRVRSIQWIRYLVSCYSVQGRSGTILMIV